MKLVAATAAALLVGGVAIGVSGVGAAVGDPTPYDFCSRYSTGANSEHITCAFTESGSAHTLTIPGIAKYVSVFAIGGRGADIYNVHTDNVSFEGPLGDDIAGKTVSVRVGGDASGNVGGYNGGGNSGDPAAFGLDGNGGGGGGASDISIDGTRVFVAPGSGGSGGIGRDTQQHSNPRGGAGGNSNTAASEGGPGSTYCGLTGGGAATDPSDGTGHGGAGGVILYCDGSVSQTGSNGADGSSDGTGGSGGSGHPDGTDSGCGVGGAGGGGGGGYVGGGGGGGGAAADDGSDDCAGGGGGGAGGAFVPTLHFFTNSTSAAPIVSISWDQTLTITSSGRAPAGHVGEPYSYQLTTDVPGSNFRVVSGTTPPGLTLSASGLLSGRPTTVGTSGFTVEASDPDDAAQRQQVVSVTVDAPSVAFTNAPPNATKGKAYSFQFTTSNCTGCVFSRVAGQGGLPHGLSLSSAGKLSGTPTTVENASFVIQAASSDGRSGQQRFSVRVSAAPAFAVNDVSVTESSGTAKFTITLNPSASGTVSVHYATANGTAVAPGDYTAVSGTATFTAGQTTKTVSVPIKNDTTHEGAETFRLVLSSPSGATVADGTGVATIAASD